MLRHHTITIYIFLLLGLFSGAAYAQLPNCNNSSIFYYMNTPSGNIYTFDPNQPLSSANPTLNTIQAPGDAIGLAVCYGINGSVLGPTFYITNGQFYYYYNGTTWVNTNHKAGHTDAVNIGSGGGYIYNIRGSGEVYRYDGTGDDVLLTTIPDFLGGGPYDLACDCEGNFYLLRNMPPKFFRKYNSNGVLQQSWTVTGSGNNDLGGGMAILGGNKIYYNNFDGYWEGTIGATNVSFNLVTAIGLPNNPVDFASCAFGSSATSPVKASIDTGYYCGSGPGIPVTATGSTNLAWKVISGNATVNGTGSNVNITATTSSQIEVSDNNNTCGQHNADTVTVIIPTATLDAGPDITINGCGTSFYDTLDATLGNTLPWLLYYAQWSPAGSIISGINTLQPVINPAAKTKYYIALATDPAHGGCTWTDSVTVDIRHVRVTAGFSEIVKYGCEQDTVLMGNVSGTSFGSLSYQWDFGDGQTATTKHATHIYLQQGSYNIVLVAQNGSCTDTASRQVNLSHPLAANFTVSDTLVCLDDTVSFNGTSSNIALLPGRYTWYWDDGSTGNGSIASHSYSTAGTHRAMLVITDSLRCTDTTAINIHNTLPYPYINLGPADTLLCDANSLILPLGDTLAIETYRWQNGAATPTYTVSEQGKYTVTASNTCGTSTDSIMVFYENCHVWFPSAFTPNGDGKNDRARLGGNTAGVTDFVLRIYNRWGQPMFETTDVSQGWDGRHKGSLQPIGAYYYLLQYKYLGKSVNRKGDITLVL